MKSRTNVEAKDFKPVDVVLTFESQDEVDAICKMTFFTGTINRALREKCEARRHGTANKMSLADRNVSLSLMRCLRSQLLKIKVNG